jgi:hypothetical protein
MEKAVLFNRAVKSTRTAPSGKVRNPRMYSSANPFQGRAKARLSKSKKSKKKLFKKRNKQKGRYRKGPKPGRSFNMKRTLSRSRLKSSGSRTKSGGGKKKKNKNLFNTRK